MVFSSWTDSNLSKDINKFDFIAKSNNVSLKEWIGQNARKV